MGKRLVALLALVCILLTGTAVGAEGMTEKVMAALSEISRDIVVPALPFISDDDGLVMLQEALDKQQQGQDAGILGSVITQALTYTDAETLQNGIDSLYLFEESFRRKCHNIYQNCEALSLSTEESKGAQVLLGFLYRKDPDFKTVLANHQITDGVLAKLLNACTSLVSGSALYRYDGENFSVKAYPADLVNGLNAIWQPTIPGFDALGYIERGADALNSISNGADRDAAIAFLKKCGVLSAVKPNQGDGGGKGGASGDGTLPVKPIESTGAYETIDALAGFEDAALTFTVTKGGRIVVPGTYAAPVVYQVVDNTEKPVKMALYMDGKIVAELGEGTYIVKESASYFNDVSGWAQTYVEALYARGIVGGKAPGAFMPGDNITREEFVKLVTELFDMVDGNAVTSFEDVKAGAWYYSYVASAQKSGIVGGVSATEFGVGAKIKRQDMAKIICDMLKKQGVAMNPADPSVFKDYGAIADYAKEQVLSVYRAGIISGDDTGNFNPNQFATRAEAAKMVYGMIVAVLTKG